MITVKLIDREAIVHLVEGLEDFEKDKAIKSGLRSGLNVIQRKGRSNLRTRLLETGKGSLIGSFATKIKKSKLGGLSGFRRSNKYVKLEKAGNHAHLVDGGTKMRHNRKGQKRGIMPANRFWKDAISTEETKALDKVYEGVERAVQRINNRQ